MTTPTREQVVQWAKGCGDPEKVCPVYDRDGHLEFGIFYEEEMTKFATLARADLEATIAEQAKEIAKLINAVADHVTVRSDQRQQLAEQAAEIERLQSQRRDWLDTDKQAIALVDQERELIELRQQLATSQAYAEQLREAYQEQIDLSDGDCCISLQLAISIPHDTTALNEYCAKMVERIGESERCVVLGLTPIDIKLIADKIRKG